MKKYRLVKKYPGSSKIGTIVTQYKNRGYEPDNPALDERQSYYPDEIENYPEFWQLIEKDNIDDGFIYVSEVSRIRVCENKVYWFINTPIGYEKNTYGNWTKKHYVPDPPKSIMPPIAFNNQKEAKDYCYRYQPLYRYQDAVKVVEDVIKIWATDVWNDLVWDKEQENKLHSYILLELMKGKKRPKYDR